MGAATGCAQGHGPNAPWRVWVMRGAGLAFPLLVVPCLLSMLWQQWPLVRMLSSEPVIVAIMLIGMLAVLAFVAAIILYSVRAATWPQDRCIRCEVPRLISRRARMLLIANGGVMVAAPVIVVAIAFAKHRELTSDDHGAHPATLPTASLTTTGAADPSASKGGSGERAPQSIERIPAPAAAPAPGAPPVQPVTAASRAESRDTVPDPASVAFAQAPAATSGDLTGAQSRDLDALLTKLAATEGPDAAGDAVSTREVVLAQIGQLPPVVIGAAVPVVMKLLEREQDVNCQVAGIMTCARAYEAFPGKLKEPFAELLRRRFIASPEPKVRSAASSALRVVAP